MRTSQAPHLCIDEIPSRLSATTVMEGEMSRRGTASGLWGTATHQGHLRTRNEDAILVEPDLGLYAVLDGMGGAAAGDVASNLAARTLAAFVRENLGTQELRLYDLLEAALNAAAIAVHDLATDSTEHRGMGTTVVACLIGPARQVSIAHAGDSRAYVLRDQRMRQLTRDHTISQQYIDEGRPLSPEAHAIYKTVVTRNLGQERGVAPDLIEERLEVGDRLLLCSDGLNDALPDEAIQQILSSRDAPSHIARRLLEAALTGPCRDNVSVLVLDLE
ncbi:MAG: PP2C family protein-serine/threonine phosphatase [Solirubrobacterales bacterium]